MTPARVGSFHVITTEEKEAADEPAEANTKKKVHDGRSRPHQAAPRRSGVISPEDPRPPERPRSSTLPLVVGSVWWIVFCVVAVWLRGFRWDENYEFAQVLLGQIAYPEGHPLLQCIRGVYNLQIHALAWLMALDAGPFLANGVRNALSLVATTLPVFLATFALCRRVLWAHAAVLLVLAGVHVTFFSSYPIQTWPTEYSNGHVGTGYAIAAVALLMAGYRRAFGFFTGLMASVHLGQLPPVLGLLAVYVALAWWDGRALDARRALGWTAVGLLPSVLLWLLLLGSSSPPPTGGPFFSPIDPQTVWKSYLTHHVSHRELPWTTGQFALVGFLLLGTARSWLEHRAGRSRGPWFWVTAYAWICALAVWTAMILHAALGTDAPYVVLSWMPYRLMNHVTTLLVAASIGALADRVVRRSGSTLVVAGSLLVALVLLVRESPLRDAHLGPGTVHVTTGSEVILFGLFGAAAAMTAVRLSSLRPAFVSWNAMLAAAVVLVALLHHGCVVASVGDPYAQAWSERYPPLLGALGLTVGFVLALLVRGRKLPFAGRFVLAPLCAAQALVLLGQAWAVREHLPVTPLQRRVSAYLASRGESDAMILVPHQQQALQARLGASVMTDIGAFNWIPYKPSVGRSQFKIYRDLYGINFAPAEGEAAYPALHWASLPERAVWPRWTLTEWQRLAAEYDFRYVLAPNAVRPVNLPLVLPGIEESLYVVPRNDSAAGGTDREAGGGA